ncbi:MAG: DUF4249 domain-containing protein [Flavobacteriia bacterium]|nr:DUF4249 domain-containing protein [Flavobacteriia bacterium]
MKKLALIALAVPFISCETTIDFDGDLADPQIVVSPVNYNSSSEQYYGAYGFHTDMNMAEVVLSTSINILDNGFPEPLENAIVQIREKDQGWRTFTESVSDGYYTQNQFQFEEGKSYEFRASRNNYESVTGSFSIPVKVEIDDVRLIRKVEGDTSFGEPNYWEYEVDFTDPGGSRYYSLSAYFVTTQSPHVVVSRYYITSASPFTQALSDGDYYYYDEALYMNNTLFEGKKVTIPIRVQDPLNPITEYSLGVVLRSLDENAYKYNSSIQRYNFFGGGGDPFSQPVQVFTNIQNGLGYVGGFSLDIFVD